METNQEKSSESKIIQQLPEAKLYSDLPHDFHDDMCDLEIKNVGVDLGVFLNERMPTRDSEKMSSAVSQLMQLDSSTQKPAPSKRIIQKKGLTSKQRQKFSVYKIEKNPGKYEAYLPLHTLWLEYFRKVMNLDSLDNSFAKDDRGFYSKLSKADYHGCIMTVTRSKCPSVVGITGILLQEGKNSMKLITKEDKLKIIPKANNVFTFEVDGFAFTLNGNHFCVKTSHRAVKKFKAKATIDL